MRGGGRSPGACVCVCVYVLPNSLRETHSEIREHLPDPGVSWLPDTMMIKKMNVKETFTHVHHMNTDSLSSLFVKNMPDMHNTVQGATAEGLKSRMRLRSRGLPTPDVVTSILSHLWTINAENQLIPESFNVF